MRSLRRASQIIFFSIFFVLLLKTEYAGTNKISYPVKIFLDFDPLVFFSLLLSNHGIPSEAPRAIFWALILIFGTLVLGRFFCGWVCPLGSLNHLGSSLRKKKEGFNEVYGHNWKYYLLVMILVSSFFTMALVGLMDPISLTIRSFSISILPAINYTLRAIFDTLYEEGPEVILKGSEAVYSLLRAYILSFNQPYFQQAFLLGLLFIGVLALNLIQHSFWCRSLCPLGALLGLCSRYSILRLTHQNNCNACNLCLLTCRGAAQPIDSDKWQREECVLCWNCQAICPQQTPRFQWSMPWKQNRARLSLERRQLLFSAFSGLIFIPLIKVNPHARIFEPRLIRPPGALTERDFLRRCVRCGECLKVCLTNGLQPTFLEAGLEGIWSPMLAPRLGYCEYSCTLCGQVCPTGAIKNLEEAEKKKIKIGLAFIDQGRCLPIAFGITCIVCEEHCPTPKKAIWFEENKVFSKDGKFKLVKQPRVDLDLCIGCGICEYKCPVKDQPAIRITSIGETRAPDKQNLLSSNISLKQSP